MSSYKGQHNNKIVNKHFKGYSNLLAAREMPVNHLLPVTSGECGEKDISEGCVVGRVCCNR